MRQYSEHYEEHLRDIRRWVEGLDVGIKCEFIDLNHGEVAAISRAIPMMALAGDWVWEPKWQRFALPTVQTWSNWERPSREVLLRGVQEFETLYGVQPTGLTVLHSSSLHFWMYQEPETEARHTESCPRCMGEKAHSPDCVFYPGPDIPWTSLDKESDRILYHVCLDGKDREDLIQALSYAPLRDLVDRMLPVTLLGARLSEQDMDFLLSLTAHVGNDRTKERLRRVFSHRVVDTYPYKRSQAKNLEVSPAPAGAVKTPTPADLHGLSRWILETLGFKLDRQDQSGLADWWSHPELGELLVVGPEAADFPRRYRELISELCEKLGCPSDHDLRLDWIGRLVAKQLLDKAAALRKDD